MFRIRDSVFFKSKKEKEREQNLKNIENTYKQTLNGKQKRVRGGPKPKPRKYEITNDVISVDEMAKMMQEEQKRKNRMRQQKEKRKNILGGLTNKKKKSNQTKPRVMRKKSKQLKPRVMRKKSKQLKPRVMRKKSKQLRARPGIFKKKIN
jgi:hypothetical protein